MKDKFTVYFEAKDEFEYDEQVTRYEFAAYKNEKHYCHHEDLHNFDHDIAKAIILGYGEDPEQYEWKFISRDEVWNMPLTLDLL